MRTSFSQRLFLKCYLVKDTEQKGPWWEEKYIVFGPAHPKVRKNLENLMSTHIAALTNKEFMLSLTYRTREDYTNTLKKTIKDRMADEVEREKLLFLAGLVPLDKAPKALFDHPVVRIEQTVRNILEEWKRKAEKARRHKTLKVFDYNLLDLDREDSEKDEGWSSCTADSEFSQLMEIMEDYVGEKAAFDEEEYSRIKYRDDDVIEMESLERLDELYDQAEMTLGPLSGKRLRAYN